MSEGFLNEVEIPAEDANRARRGHRGEPPPLGELHGTGLGYGPSCFSPASDSPPGDRLSTGDLLQRTSEGVADPARKSGRLQA